MRSSRRSRRPSPISCRGSVTRLGACPSAPPPRAPRRAPSPATRRSTASARVGDTDNRIDALTITVGTKPGTSGRAAGEDLKAGETILRRGTVLRAAEIGVLATLGKRSISVTRRPRVAIVSTGDELAELDAPLRPGQIRDANRYSLARAVSAIGLEPPVLGIVRDTAD